MTADSSPISQFHELRRLQPLLWRFRGLYLNGLFLVAETTSEPDGRRTVSAPKSIADLPERLLMAGISLPGLSLNCWGLGKSQLKPPFKIVYHNYLQKPIVMKRRLRFKKALMTNSEGRLTPSNAILIETFMFFYRKLILQECIPTSINIKKCRIMY